MHSEIRDGHRSVSNKPYFFVRRSTRKKEIQEFSFVRGRKRLYSNKDNKLGPNGLGIKKDKQTMAIDFATTFMLLMVALSTACGIASIIRNNLR